MIDIQNTQFKLKDGSTHMGLVEVIRYLVNKAVDKKFKELEETKKGGK